MTWLTSSCKLAMMMKKDKLQGLLKTKIPTLLRCSFRSKRCLSVRSKSCKTTWQSCSTDASRPSSRCRSSVPKVTHYCSKDTKPRRERHPAYSKQSSMTTLTDRPLTPFQRHRDSSMIRSVHRGSTSRAWSRNLEWISKRPWVKYKRRFHKISISTKMIHPKRAYC